LFYFLSEGVYLLPVWVAWWILGPGRAYGMIYSLFGSIVLLAAVGVAWDLLRNLRGRWKSAGIALVIVSGFTHTTYLGLSSIRWWDVVCLTEASVFMWAGIVVLYTVYMARRFEDVVNFTLGVYWVLLAGFNYIFLIVYPRWLSLNLWVPQAMEAVTFILISVWLTRRRILRTA
jgi:hypothetical protein